MNTDWDPYEVLQTLEYQNLLLTAETDHLSSRLAETCQLQEQMALQLRYLTNAVIRMQEVNKITNSRLDRLEKNRHDI
jgi:hypothetical protein